LRGGTHLCLDSQQFRTPPGRHRDQRRRREPASRSAPCARSDRALHQSRFDAHDEVLDAAARTRVLVICSTEHGAVGLQRVRPAAERYRLAGLQRKEQGRVEDGGTERLVQPAFRTPDDDSTSGDRTDSV